MSRPPPTTFETLTFLLPGVANAFEELSVCAALREGGPWRVGVGTRWRAIHVRPSLPDFEVEHGRELERDRYNVHCMTAARSKREMVRGAHAGLSDLFVPIVVGDRVPAVLAVGPFERSRPTTTEILARWRWITGRQGHPADPEFAYYLSMTLSTLVLDGDLEKSFERFLVCLARLFGGDGREETIAQADSLRAALYPARSAERTWEAARSMVDERTARAWSSPTRTGALSTVGLSRVPDRVLVGLVVTRPDADPVGALLRRDAFQRACVGLAQAVGDVIAGTVGDYGVMFLSPTIRSTARTSQKMLDLADKAATLARRRFALDLHLGLSTLPPTAPLSEHYESALGAAETALSRDVRIASAVRDREHATFPLHELRRHLVETVAERPGELPALWERYLEAVALHCGYQVETARGHLEAGFEHVAGALLEGAVLDEKTYVDTSRGLAKAAREARTLAELAFAYRRVIADMTEASRHPVHARRDRSLSRAVAYIHRHYAEPLRLADAARAGGFARNYFSALFKRHERMTFARYVLELRIARAKELLVRTDLGMRQVAELSGFRTRFYLGGVFKRAVGKTPLQWRRAATARATKRNAKSNDA
jgi:AraC-like DNA-binding protein